MAVPKVIYSKEDLYLIQLFHIMCSLILITMGTDFKSSSNVKSLII